MPETTEQLLSPDVMRQLDRLDVVSRKVFAGLLQGERRSKRRGQSVEFADYRNYAPGDDLRFIDWNLYARLDRLFLRLFMEEVDLSVSILLDTTRSMDFGEPRKSLIARRVAAAVGYIGLAASNRVSVYTLGAGVTDRLPAMRGRGQAPRLLRFLEDAPVTERGDLEAACRQFASQQRHKGVVLLISDMLDKGDLSAALKWIGGQRFDTFVLHVLSPQELDPAAAGYSGDIRLRDVEDNAVTDMSIDAAVMRQYRDTLAAFREDTRQACLKRGATYLFADTTAPFDTLVLKYLREGGLLG